MGEVKPINQDQLDIVKRELQDKSSAKRRSAAKKIGKSLINQLGPDLFNAYLNERKDPRTWETQVEMIKALGRLRYHELLPYVEEIVRKDIEFDMITIQAATAFVKLKFTSTKDVSFITELIKNHRYSVQLGSLYAVFYENIKPDPTEMHRMINAVLNSYHPESKGHFDTRRILAIILSTWPKDISHPVLESLRQVNSIQSIVIDSALKGKPYATKEY